MISRLGKAMLAALLVLGLSLSGCSAPPFDWPGTQGLTDTRELLSNDIRNNSDSLFSDIQRLGNLADDSGSIRVVIRLEGASLLGVAEQDVVGELRQHAAISQDEAMVALNNISATVLNTFWLTNAMLVEVPADRLHMLTWVPRVERLFENFTVTVPEPTKLEPTEIEPDYIGDYTWGLHKIGVPDVWALGYNGTGIRVAVLDTGVDMAHPDLAGRMYTINATDPTFPGGWIEFDEFGDIVGNSTPHDTHYHGTHVSGTVLGGDYLDIAIGVAPGAWLMHSPVLSGPDGSGTFAQIVAGMEWAVDPFDQYKVEAGEPADVVNMSLGAPGFWHEFMIDPIENARDAGVVVIASIGNRGEGTSGSPGNIKEAFGIGATNEDDYVAAFSGGLIVDQPEYPEPYVKPDFSAPGVDVLSAISLWYMPPYGWAWVSGTSMAAPHAAGTVALMLQADPSLTVDDVYDILKNTGVWYDEYYHARPCTRYGWGRIDAHYAILETTLDSGIEGTITGNPSGPLEGVRVSIDAIGQSRYTDEDGYYKFYLPPGSYNLTATKFGYGAEFADEVAVFEDTFTTQDFELTPLDTGAIAGTVIDSETGLPIPGATITILHTPLSTSTSALGDYSIEVPIGTYSVRAESLGYAPDTVTDVEVTKDAIVTIDFALDLAPSADWRWLYPADWRPAEDSSIGLGDPGVWYGAMRIDLSDDIGERISLVAYHDASNLFGNYAQVHVAEHVEGGEHGAPGPWLASTDLYYPEEAGWVELGLTGTVPIEEPGIYWVVVELEDPGAGSFPFGVVAPSVKYADLVTWEDPHDPDAWDTLSDFGLNFSWLLEAYVGITYDLTIDSSEGGSVTVPGEGEFTYPPGTTVELVAEADDGHEFLEWTGDIGTIADTASAETTITMWGDYSITASFAPLPGVTTGTATNITPGEATVNMSYTVGEYSPVQVRFAWKKADTVTWTYTDWVSKPEDGTHSEALTGLDAEATYDFKAQLEYDTNEIEGAELQFTTLAHVAPTVTTQDATDVDTNSATVNMSYTVGTYSTVQVRFAWKEADAATWNYSDWVSESEDGTHAEALTGLDAATTYRFRAQLEYDTSEIEGALRRLTTEAPPPSEGCFIATAAYGTGSAVEINVLREFRDTVLLSNALGARFVSLYYTTSPPIADFISQNEFLRIVVRVGFVDRIVDIVNWTHSLWSW